MAHYLTEIKILLAFSPMLVRPLGQICCKWCFSKFSPVLSVWSGRGETLQILKHPKPQKQQNMGNCPQFTHRKPNQNFQFHQNWSGAKVSCQGAIDESHTHMWYFTVLSNITRNLITHLPLPLQRVPPTWELYKYARSIKCKRPDNVCCSHLASFDSATCIFMTRKKQNRSSLRDRCSSIRPHHNASLLFGVVNKTALLSSFHIPPPSGI